MNETNPLDSLLLAKTALQQAGCGRAAIRHDHGEYREQFEEAIISFGIEPEFVRDEGLA